MRVSVGRRPAAVAAASAVLLASLPCWARSPREPRAAGAQRVRPEPLRVVGFRLNKVPCRSHRPRPHDFRFSLNRDAVVRSVTVETHQGQRHVIVRLAPPRRVKAGEEVRVLWDGRDARGRPVAAGAYLLTVTAQDGSGSSCSQHHPLMVLR